MYSAIFTTSDHGFARYNGERVDILDTSVVVPSDDNDDGDESNVWHTIRFSDGNEAEVNCDELSDWRLYVLTPYTRSSTMLTP